MSDQKLLEIVQTPIMSLEDVISVMEKIDVELLNNDGLKWFNLLYLLVTKEVKNQPPENGWADPNWLERLDVIFAGLYFEAIKKWIIDRNSTPKSWRVFFDARQNPQIMRVQFALCGMNAHINRDLSVGLFKLNKENNFRPTKDSPQHQDFEYVNEILEKVEPMILKHISTGIVGIIDESLGRLDNVLAMWGVRKARDFAWGNSNTLWGLRKSQTLVNNFIEVTDGIVSAFGRGLILPVPH